MRALVSVSDKAGLVPFVNSLVSLGWEIIATGGTMKLLQDNGIKVINISETTDVTKRETERLGTKKQEARLRTQRQEAARKARPFTS